MVGFYRYKANNGSIYFNFRFNIAQHSGDILLINLLIKYFNCGKVHLLSNTNRCNFYLQYLNNIYNIIIPHLDKYPLNNNKQLDYADFKIIANLFKSDGIKNTEMIKKIIYYMNSRRE